MTRPRSRAGARVGRQRIVTGPLPPHPMPGSSSTWRRSTRLSRVLRHRFHRPCGPEGPPFFVCSSDSHARLYVHLPEVSADEHGRRQVGSKRPGWRRSTTSSAGVWTICGIERAGAEPIVVFTTDNGAETFTWPDGGNTPFAGAKGTILEGGMRVPMLVRWPGRIAPGTVQNGVMSVDRFPTLVAAAGNPYIATQLLQGQAIGGRTYRVHLDGVQPAPTPPAKAHRTATRSSTLPKATWARYGSRRLQVSLHDQPARCGRCCTPTAHCQNRVDPFERLQFPTPTGGGAFGYPMDFFGHEFWRFTFVQQEVARCRDLLAFSTRRCSVVRLSASIG